MVCRNLWIIVVLALTGGAFGCQSTSKPGTQGDPWINAERIIEQIAIPKIPDQTYLLSDFGGNGDGSTDNKAAFDQVLSVVEEAGGGRILVEPGTYLIHGPIHLGSHMNLHLEEGARLVFGNRHEDYLPVVLTSWEGTRAYNYSPFIYARGASDISITGKGEIDGNASTTWNRWKQLQDPDKKLIRSMNNQAVALSERIFGEGHYLRPHLVQFYECQNILVEDVKISDSPFWCLHFVFSSDITVRRVSYEAFNFNNDGIDPESCENVLIEDVIFNNQDDNIAIKAGRDLEARTLSKPSRNIVVRNCKFRGHNAISVGSEMSGGVNHVYVEDCTYAGKVVNGFYLKGNRDRGGMVHDIYARNIEFDSTRSALIIDSNYKNQGSCCPPVFKNIYVENITANHAADHGIYLKGSPEEHLDSVFIRNVQIKSAKQSLKVSYMDHLEMEKVRINGQTFEADGIWPEWIKGNSPETRREVWQITSDTAPVVACYFERQAFTSDEKRFFFFRKPRPGWRPAAICSQDKDGNDFIVHYESDSIKLGHGIASRDGRWFISDCQEPDENELVPVGESPGDNEIT